MKKFFKVILFFAGAVTLVSAYETVSLLNRPQSDKGAYSVSTGDVGFIREARAASADKCVFGTNSYPMVSFDLAVSCQKDCTAKYGSGTDFNGCMQGCQFYMQQLRSYCK